MSRDAARDKNNRSVMCFYRTWCDGTPTGPLARASFDLHKKFGAMFDCDYRSLDTMEVSYAITDMLLTYK